MIRYYIYIYIILGFYLALGHPVCPSAQEALGRGKFEDADVDRALKLLWARNEWVAVELSIIGGGNMW